MRHASVDAESTPGQIRYAMYVWPMEGRRIGAAHAATGNQVAVSTLPYAGQAHYILTTDLRKAGAYP